MNINYIIEFSILCILNLNTWFITSSGFRAEQLVPWNAQFKIGWTPSFLGIVLCPHLSTNNNNMPSSPNTNLCIKMNFHYSRLHTTQMNRFWSLQLAKTTVYFFQVENFVLVRLFVPQHSVLQLRSILLTSIHFTFGDYGYKANGSWNFPWKQIQYQMSWISK